MVRGLLQTRVLALIGVVSYGVYLWHEAGIALFLRWTGDPLFTIPLWELASVVTALAIVAATASYVLIERSIVRCAGFVCPAARRPVLVRSAHQRPRWRRSPAPRRPPDHERRR